MDRPYLAIDLVDDHVTYEIRMTRQVIGVYVIAGSVPRIVACGPDLPAGQHPCGGLCLNEVKIEGGMETPLRGHLTSWSVTALTVKQLKILYDNGFLDLERPGCYVELLAASPVPGAA